MKNGKNNNFFLEKRVFFSWKMKLTIEQHELRAILKNMDDMLTFVDTAHCEQAIQALVPILQSAIHAKDELEREDYAFEHKTGKDLLAAILERRKPSQKTEKKRSRVHWNDEDQGVPEWAPYKFDDAPGIVRVDSFGKQSGEWGLFLHARPNWQQKTFAFFATAESLKPIDGLYSRRYNEILGVLKAYISKLEMTPELHDFLSKTRWGKSLL